MKISNKLFNISSQVILLIILGFIANCQPVRLKPHGHQPPPIANTPDELIERIFSTAMDSAYLPGTMLSEKKMKAMIQQSVNIWNTGKLALVDKFYAPEFVRYPTDVSDKLVGLNAFKEYVTSMRGAYPDLTVKIDELLIKDDMSVTRWTFTGTNEGAIGEMPPTGKRVRVSGVTIGRFFSGKISKEWVYWNNAAVLDQLGYTFVPPAQNSTK